MTWSAAASGGIQTFSCCYSLFFCCSCSRWSPQCARSPEAILRLPVHELHSLLKHYDFHFRRENKTKTFPREYVDLSRSIKSVQLTVEIRFALTASVVVIIVVTSIGMRRLLNSTTTTATIGLMMPAFKLVRVILLIAVISFVVVVVKNVVKFNFVA